jgi:DinB superfamily
MADRTRRTFAIEDAAAILARTPAALDVQLRGLPDEWTTAHEGENTWSPLDVVAHLIHADRTNWLPRARTILEHGDMRPFDDFQRFAHLETSKGRTLPSLLDEFADVRTQSLETLAGFNLTESDLERRGGHPALGVVTLRQLLATWVVHDLDHMMQVSRVLARQYSDEVGPWRAYLRIIRDAPA